MAHSKSNSKHVSIDCSLFAKWWRNFTLRHVTSQQKSNSVYFGAHFWPQTRKLPQTDWHETTTTAMRRTVAFSKVVAKYDDSSHLRCLMFVKPVPFTKLNWTESWLWKEDQYRARFQLMCNCERKRESGRKVKVVVWKYLAVCCSDT